MKVGIYLPSSHPWESTTMMLELYETMGVDSLWAVDHMLGSFHPGLWAETALSDLIADPDAYYDPFAYGAAVGQHTNLPFGVGVTDSVRRRAPDVARSALTLHHLNPGGFHLGVGSGEAESLVPYGYDFERPVARFEEFLVELRALLDTGLMPDGGLGRMGLPLQVDGLGAPPVWVAGHGPRMLRLTGQYGDGWAPFWRMSAEDYGASRAVIAGHAETAGRPLPECGLFGMAVFGESRERLAEMFDESPLAKLIGLFAMGDVWERHGLDHPLGNDSRGFIDVVIHGLDPDELRDIAPTIPFEMVEEALWVGNTDELVEQFEPYARAGAEHVVLANATGVVGGMDEILARGAELPTLRAALGEL